MVDLAKNPSNIAQAAVKFLQEIEATQTTVNRYKDVLWLFIESLKSDDSNIKENSEGEYVLIANWDVFYGGAIESFLDWWLQRKYIGSDALVRQAPSVLKKFIEWSYKNKFFDQEHYEDFMASLPKGKSKDIRRIQTLGDLFHALHTPDPGAWVRGEIGKVATLNNVRKPDSIAEGYMVLEKTEGQFGCFRDGKKKIGPVQLSTSIVKIIMPGDTVNLVVGKFGKNWQVLESGNVYPPGAIF